MTEHHFDIDIAAKYGVNAAIILYNINYWIEKNEANGSNFYDGTYWTYNSIKAFKKQFYYMSEKAINTALKKLENEGLIITGNYNKSAYDRTKWYALTDKAKALCKKGKSIYQKGKMEEPETGNGFTEKGEPIPDSKPDNNPDNKTKDIGQKRTRFVPPTIEEVTEYCNERGNTIDPQRFIDYYETRGWMVGKNKMKSWKAAVRTWERNEFGNSITKKEMTYDEMVGDTEEWPSWEMI